MTCRQNRKPDIKRSLNYFRCLIFFLSLIILSQIWSTKKTKRMLHFPVVPGQFGPEARELGLKGWRVEKMKAVSLNPSDLGTFFTGDSYLIVNSRGDDGADLHMWIGEKSSRDEQVACAMLATQLDHCLGTNPVHHREVQGYESPEFMSLFPRGVSYKEGGVESGFRKFQSGSAPVHRLYQVKGKRNIRAREVELSWNSFNKGDCFILDLGEKILFWVGSKANMFEKQKAREIAMLIRDMDKHGKARVFDVSEGEETPEMLQILGPMPELKEGIPEEDTQADVFNCACLYKVSDATGKMTLTKISERNPFERDLLARDDCFILDNGANGQIFVWRGSGANPEEKKEALRMADSFIEQKNYPRMKTQVKIFPQGQEKMIFKQFFKDWN